MAYLIFMLRHKWFVFLECLKLGVPIWRAIIHDWDKIFAPHTFIAFKRRYDQGNDHYKMANNSAYQMAYHLHCNRRHKHHWQWWISQLDEGKQRVLEMDDVSMREMLADWRGMGKTKHEPHTWIWYQWYRSQMTVHPQTLLWLDWQIAIEAANYGGADEAAKFWDGIGKHEQA